MYPDTPASTPIPKSGYISEVAEASMVYARTEPVRDWFIFPMTTSLLADHESCGMNPLYHPPEEKLNGMYVLTVPEREGTLELCDMRETM